MSPASQLGILDAPDTASGRDDLWHLAKHADDEVALCGHVFRGEWADDEPPDDETCAACLVLDEIPCGCEVCT
jgi:hypothetical protein